MKKFVFVLAVCVSFGWVCDETEAGNPITKAVPYVGVAADAASFIAEPTVENAAGIGGGMLGTYGGAAIGTAIIPGPGTLVGGVCGFIGGCAGDYAARAAVGWFR